VTHLAGEDGMTERKSTCVVLGTCEGIGCKENIHDEPNAVVNEDQQTYKTDYDRASQDLV
jgi:hypothetical protein